MVSSNVPSKRGQNVASHKSVLRQILPFSLVSESCMLRSSTGTTTTDIYRLYMHSIPLTLGTSTSTYNT